MEERPLDDIVDEKLKEHIRYIYEKAEDEEIKTYDDEPTTTTLPEGKKAFYNTRIYRNIGGTIYYISLTAA